MSNISTNTLFHFTSKIKYLEDILKNNFIPRISVETVSSDDDEGIYSFPMKCFCDIPLSQVKKHMITYGKYAIGLSKEWAIKNKISPLIYFCPNSPTITGIIELLDLIDSNEFTHEVKSNLFNLFLFAKPYEGKFFRNGSFLKENVRFYDEREWRYIPDLKSMESSDFSFFLTDEKNCLNESLKNEINEKLSKIESIKIKFEPKDVKYIIVEEEKDILEIVDIMRNCKRQYSYEDVQILTTRIITSKQIDEDF